MGKGSWGQWPVQACGAARGSAWVVRCKWTGSVLIWSAGQASGSWENRLRRPGRKSALKRGAKTWVNAGHRLGGLWGLSTLPLPKKHPNRSEAVLGPRIAVNNLICQKLFLMIKASLCLNIYFLPGTGPQSSCRAWFYAELLIWALPHLIPLPRVTFFLSSRHFIIHFWWFSSDMLQCFWRADWKLMHRITKAFMKNRCNRSKTGCCWGLAMI